MSARVRIPADDGDITVNLFSTNQLCMYLPHMSEIFETELGRLRKLT
jgi:hypothetical protein